MTNSTIKFVFEIDGQKVVLDSIEAISTQIETAKKKLSTLGEGTTEFQSLNNEIKRGETFLKTYNSQASNLVEKTFRNYVKIGSAVVNSFGLARSALAIFGVENQAVLDAATNAQQLLTFTLSAREVAEGLVAAASLSNTQATVAETAATNGANLATKSFYKTLLANPYTAIIAGVTLLITALSVLNSKSKQAREEQENFTKAVNTEVSKSKVELNTLVNTVNNVALSTNTRKKALEDLQSKFPAYFENLDKESILLGQTKIDTERLTNAIIAQSKARVITGDLEKSYNKEREAAAKLADATKELTAAEKSFAAIQKNIASYGQGAPVALATAQARVRAARDAKESAQKEVDAAKLKSQGYEKEIQTLNQLTDSTIGTATATEKLVKAEKNLIDPLEELYNVELEIIRAQNELTKQYAILGSQGYKLNVSQIKIVEELQKQLDKTKSYRDSIIDLLPYQDQLYEKFKQTFEIQENKLGPIFEKFTKASQEYLTTLQGQLVSTDDLAKNFERIRIEAGLTKEILDKFADEPTIIATQKLVSNYELLGKFLARLSTAKIEPPFSISEFQTAFRALAELEAETVILNPDKAQAIRLEAKRQQDQFVKAFIELGKTGTDYQKEIQSIQTKFAGDIEKQNALIKELNDGLAAAGEEAFNGLKETALEVNNFEIGIVKVNTTVAKLRQEIKNLQLDGAAFAGFLLENRQTFAKAFDIDLESLASNQQKVEFILKEVGDKTYDQQKTLEEDVNNFTEQLLAQGVDLRKLSYEARLELLKDFLLKEKTELDAAQTEEDKRLSEREKRYKEFFDSIQNVLASIQQTVNAYYNYQFEVLEKRNQRAQETITGDSARANELRLEQEKIYNEEKKKLEKESAKASLRIQLAQSLANTAESISKIINQYATLPPLAIAISAVVAGLQATQTAIIAKQLIAIDQYRKGGVIKGQGGLVVGNSHEQGGVMFGGYELEGGESVINRKSTIQYSQLLNQVNLAGGGKPIVYNNFDDSRIVEAIAKQRQTPIRAFVVEKDITNSIKTQTRLEQIAQL